MSDYIVEIEGLVKRYKLYSGPKQFVADQLGLRKLPFRRWEPIPEFQALHGVDFKLRHGERIGRTSNIYSGLPSRATVLVKLSPLILGTGHYVVSVMAENADSGELLDIRSGVGALNFAASNESDPPKIHVLSRWQYDDGAVEEGRLSSML